MASGLEFWRVFGFWRYLAGNSFIQVLVSMMDSTRVFSVVMFVGGCADE